ncbi:MAG: ribbon-helix-helix domain-containing protein [Nocardioidaceae bacterium]
MTNRATVLVQARVPDAAAHQLDDDARALGLANRSEAVREAMRLLHHKARQAALARDYDTFYGTDTEAPVSDVTAVGDQIAAEAIVDQQKTH